MRQPCKSNKTSKHLESDDSGWVEEAVEKDKEGEEEEEVMEEEYPEEENENYSQIDPFC
jgi:hypothetical protein